MKSRLNESSSTLPSLAQRVLEFTEEAVVVRDRDGKIAVWNAAAERLFGYTAAEAIGCTPEELLKTDSAVPQDSEPGRPWSGKLLQTHKNGSKILVSARFVHDQTLDAVYAFFRAMPGENQSERIAPLTPLIREELELSALIDVAALQRLMDDFYAVAHIPMAILDLKGRILVAVGWQDICTNFHRVQPEACRHCLESDTELSKGIGQGEFRMYKCKNNLWDVATPIIVAGQHVGNIFIGQFFFEGEEVDLGVFRKQAKRYGFNEKQYLAALARVPRLSRDTVERGMSFFLKLADTLSQLGYANLTLARLLSERDRLTVSLQESEERFRVLFEGHGAAMLLIEPDSGRIVDANTAAASFYLFSREQLRTMSIDDLNELPSDRVASERRSAVERRRDRFIFPHRLADGRTRWVEVYSTPVTIRGNLMLFSIVHDITARREAEQGLRQSEEKLRNAFANATIGLAITTPDGSFVDVNPAFSRITGYTLEELSAKRIYHLIYHDDVEENSRLVRQMIAGEISDFTVENRYVKRSGEIVWVRKSTAIVRTPEGVAQWVISLIEDISERKRAENALIYTTEELRRSNDDLQQFAYVASHDLQEPLRIISGFVTLLAQRYEQRLDEKAKTYIRHVVEGTKRMSQLITDLLAYSRVESKGQTLQPIDTVRALNMALENLMRAIQQSGAKITFESLPTVQGDLTQLVQLFQNLVANAIKFRNPDRECSIQISAKEIEGFWQFSVRDNGIGIDPQYHEKIFVIFQRLHTIEKYQGTGIGLAICKRIVERRGGRIWVESEPGKESIFHFTLPASTDSEGPRFA